MIMGIRLNETQHFEKHAILQTSNRLRLYVIQSELQPRLHILNEFKDYWTGEEFEEFYHKLN